MVFNLVPAGSFIMGTDENTGEGDESPPHEVQITQPFYLGRFEVTQAQWRRIMGSNPSHFQGDTLPVDSVSWNDVQQFLGKLAQKTGRRLALPTEAQWEYACRAGTVTPWNFGREASAAVKFAWLDENSEGKTHPVGEKKPNGWGFYDMHGNVWEWCSDWYAKHAYPNHEDINPTGPPQGESRVLRGGAWGDSTDGARSTVRNCCGPAVGNPGTGFRCVLLIEPRARPVADR